MYLSQSLFDRKHLLRLTPLNKNSMGQWRWTLTDDKDVKWMEAGQRPVLRDAMEDVAKTVEYMLKYEDKGE